MKLGSLFDGSGGFPLGGIIAGITPAWASEIEPFPIRVTEKRLPQMKHYGDVSKISGADLEPVDVITFGSPCQDMSIAGKRAGLDGARSGLFFQAVRIIKEMRAKYQKPRFIVWENVRGALSSAGGDDFRRVLEEICNVKKSDVSVPKPEKWNNSGLIVGDDFSIAWRVLDAQYWRVPQRRKRIYLVADFDGESAGKILFESEGVSGHSEKMQSAWQEFARTAQNGAGETGWGKEVLNDQGGSAISVEHDLSPTLRAETHQHLPIVYRADTARTLDNTGGSPACNQGGMVMFDNHSAGARYCGPYRSASPTPNADHPHFAVFDNHSQDSRYNGPLKLSPSLNTQLGTGGNNAPLVCLQGSMINRAENVPTSADNLYLMSKSYHFAHATPNQADALVATDYKCPPVVNADWRVRMITPLECARLQGFPDWWTDCLTDENPPDDEVRKWQGIFDEWCDINGKKHKSPAQVRKWLQTEHPDSAKYKLWGNGVALPCVVFVLCGIAAITENEKNITK